MGGWIAPCGGHFGQLVQRLAEHLVESVVGRLPGLRQTRVEGQPTLRDLPHPLHGGQKVLGVLNNQFNAQLENLIFI